MGLPPVPCSVGQRWDKNPLQGPQFALQTAGLLPRVVDVAPTKSLGGAAALSLDGYLGEHHLLWTMVERGWN